MDGNPLTVELMIAAMDAAGVRHAIQVTPSLMGYDNRYGIEAAGQYPDRFRVLARFDATAPDPRRRLKTLLSEPAVVGVRVLAPPFVLTDNTLEPFWDAAEALDARVALFAPNQPREISRIAQAHEGMTLIVDHFALANFDAVTSFEHWPEVMRLARHTNIVMKLSGLPEAIDEPYPSKRVLRHTQEAFTTFGPDRLMWGSNYPPVRKWCGYRETLAYIEEEASFISPGDRAMILAGTASRVFRLPW